MLMTKSWLARTSCTFAAFAKPFAQGSQSINSSQAQHHRLTSADIPANIPTYSKYKHTRQLP